MRERLVVALSLVLLLGGCSKTPLEAARGQWVLVNYWAIWCKPCIQEHPELNELDHSRSNVTVLGVNYDNLAGDELQSQLDELGVEFATLPEDPAAQLGVASPQVLPTTFILDPEGNLGSTLVGPQTLDSLNQALVRAGAPAG